MDRLRMILLYPVYAVGVISVFVGALLVWVAVRYGGL